MPSPPRRPSAPRGRAARLRRPHAALAALLAGAALLAAGCGDDDGDGSATTGGGEAVKVVATTTVLGDVAREVGGGAVDVTQLLQPNSDPHDYEPRPDDMLATADAQLVLASGDGLDDWAEDVVAQSGADATLLDVATMLPVQRENADDEHGHDEHGDADDGHEDHGHDDEGHAEDGHAAGQDGDDDHADEDHAEDAPGDDAHAGHDHGPVDPHWWHDPTNVEAATLAIRDALSRAQPASRAAFAANADAYVERLHALDAGIRRCLAPIPAARRKIVTDHDSLGYFADRYDIEVVGAVIPSLTTQAQASAGDVAELARVIEREGVTAVFSEPGSSAKLPKAVARETGVSAEYQLYGDTLGPEGSDAATYLGMEAHNADAIARGLTGGRRGCTIEGI